jgi:hypothetical protein
MIKPFPKKAVKTRRGPGGKSLSYITARALMERLDLEVGAANWQTRFHEVAGKCCCELGIKIDGEWVWKSDGAGETSIEGEKGGFSDAFKRAGVHFGYARELYPDALEARIAFSQARIVAEALSDQSPYAPEQEAEMYADALKHDKDNNIEDLF